MDGFQYKYGDRPLEGYTIQRAVGRGGFGEVYYAVSDSGREVALKVVQGYEQIELRGVSQCMNLKSPHLVTIFDVRHNEQGTPFVIMELVAGPSLRERLQEAPSGLGIQKSAFFLREIAKGLTFLHDRGIVHRDLKPGNIFYEDGYVKIGDYGLSKAMSTGENSVQTITVGTVHYMAPEIGQGRYDRGIDIYALGVILYEMLTGQVPFFGASHGEILMKHLSAEPDVTGIEEPFASVIRKAMAKDPAERYPSAQEMVEAVFGTEHIRESVSHFRPESLGFLLAWNDPEETPGYKTDFEPGFIEKVLTRAADRVPVFENLAVNPKRAWAGLYEMTPDHHCILGAVDEVRGFFLANGFSGHGVMHAPATGKILSDLILEGSTSVVNPELLSVNRFATGRLLEETAVL